MDVIQLKNLRIYAYHGCHKEERLIGAWFTVSVSVFCNMEDAVKSDQLEKAVDYVLLKKLVEEEMAIPSNLIEHVAGRIAMRIKNEFENTSVEIELYKEQPPFNGLSAGVSVKIKR